jgi:ABC-2 type transport system permease protein
MNTLRAILAAFVQQWKTTGASSINLGFFFVAVPSVAVIAWVALRSDNPQVLTYLLVGAPLAFVWNGVILRVGWSLSTELFGRTLEFTLISRTPMILALLGKALAHIAFGLPVGVIALITMFIVTRQLPEVANFPMLLVSLLLVIVGLAIISLLLAPAVVLAGGRAGFFNSIMALGVLVSGFMFPIDQLPTWLEVIARLLPTSWAMSGIWQSIIGPESIWSVLGAWGACLLTSAAWMVITYFLFKAVERRIRVTGMLSNY